MKIDGPFYAQLGDAIAETRRLEAIGYDGIYTLEGNSDPFLPLVMVAEHSKKLDIATGIAVACQTERSQHQNRAYCWDMLRSRLYEIELERKKAETGAFVGEKSDIGWGHQIRSYVLQPYQLVKDLRTGVESRTPSDVLDGDLDAFMAAALAQEVGGKPREKIEDIE